MFGVVGQQVAQDADLGVLWREPPYMARKLAVVLLEPLVDLLLRRQFALVRPRDDGAGAGAAARARRCAQRLLDVVLDAAADEPGVFCSGRGEIGAAAGAVRACLKLPERSQEVVAAGLLHLVVKRTAGKFAAAKHAVECAALVARNRGINVRLGRRRRCAESRHAGKGKV